MTHEEVLQKMGESLKKVRPETDLSKADESTRLTEDLGMDSLSMLLFALQSEKDFGIHFENAGTSTFKTVGDICRYIEGKL
ncbi:MAG: acyl carrier protein [Lachnospiraceae bacterium]|nr:acyl carrier protein [Lachnospiraceae bacterium]